MTGRIAKISVHCLLRSHYSLGSAACAPCVGYVVPIVYVSLVTSEGVKQEEPLAVFRSPSSVPVVCCRGAYIVVGCDDGQVRSRTLSSGMRREAQATVRAHLAWVYYTHAA